jgi:hypothetical protein
MTLKLDSDLPLEIWAHICYFLRQQDLGRLCLLSKFVLSTVRPILYREIFLIKYTIYGGEKTSVECCQETLKLLKKNQALARRVLELHMTQYWDSSSRILISALREMVNVRLIHIDSRVFPNVRRQREFVELLSGRIVPLQELKFSDRGYFWGEGVAITLPGLKVLKIQNTYPREFPSVILLTLNHI